MVITSPSAVDLSYLSINWQNPVNHSHPINKDLSAWWINVPHWKGGGAGTVLRDLLNGHHATLSSTMTASDWVNSSRPHGFGRAIEFDGVNDQLRALHPSTGANKPAPPPGSFTVMSWVQVDDDSQDGALQAHRMDGSRGFQLYFDTVSSVSGRTKSIKWLFGADGADVEIEGATDSIVQGRWHCAFGIFEAGVEIRLVIDGIEDPNSPISTTKTEIDQTDTSYTLGGNSFTNDFLLGKLDDSRVWNRALTVKDCLAVYENCLAGYPGLLNRMWQPHYSEQTVAAGGSSVHSQAIIIS